MEPDQQLRNLRDFLLVYNRMTEICFQRCTSNFNYRNLTMDEERCVDSCAGKLIRSNHRLMGTYVQLMPRMVQRRMEEMESKAKEMAESAAAAAPAPSPQVPPAAEALPASQTPITSSPPAVLPSIANDVGQDAQGSVLKPAGLDIPVDLGAAVSKSTTATEVNLSAAAPFTPAAEAVVNGPSSYTAHFPQPPTAGAQTESVSSVATLIPSRPISSSEDVPVPTVTTPTVSQSSEVPPVSGQ